MVKIKTSTWALLCVMLALIVTPVLFMNTGMFQQNTWLVPNGQTDLLFDGGDDDDDNIEGGCAARSSGYHWTFYLLIVMLAVGARRRKTD